MSNQNITTEIAAVLDNPKLGKSEKISELERMRENARAEMRAASESAMVDDTGNGDELQHLDEALEKLGSNPESIEDRGAATL